MKTIRQLQVDDAYWSTPNIPLSSAMTQPPIVRDFGQEFDELQIIWKQDATSTYRLDGRILISADMEACNLCHEWNR